MNKPATVMAHPRPQFAAEAQKEFEALLQAAPELEFVDAVVADICGVLRGKRLPIAEASRLFEHGMQLPHSVYLMDAHGEMMNPFGRGFGDGDPDGTAWPVPGTVSRVWNAKRAQLLLTLLDARGAPDPGEPRSCLARVLERFDELGLTPVCALELEFYLIDRARDDNGAPLPPRDPVTGTREPPASVFGMEDLDRYQGFLAALDAAAQAQHVPLSAASKEYGPGQFEANLKHQSDACRAADHAVFLKQIVREAARTQGLEATFMAKPYPARAGSGLHIHLSLIDCHGRNAFADGRQQGSDLLRHALGGLQALMPASMALFAPSVNSYRRFEPDMFAPVNRSWGLNNRSTGLRIPAGVDEARRFEHRVSGADANPYLALAAVLAGVHHGLTERLDPGEPATGNVSRDPDLALPFTIDAALARLGESDVLASYLGEETLALYRETKRIETARLRHIISRAEYEWYL